VDRGGSAEQSRQRLFLSNCILLVKLRVDMLGSTVRSSRDDAGVGGKRERDLGQHVHSRTAGNGHGTWGCTTARRMTLNCLKTCLIELFSFCTDGYFAGSSTSDRGTFSSAGPAARMMQRKPRWLIPVSTICGWRAAGR
jgi:hypothetical protein